MLVQDITQHASDRLGIERWNVAMTRVSYGNVDHLSCRLRDLHKIADNDTIWVHRNINMWIHVRSPSPSIEYYIKDLAHVPPDHRTFAKRVVFQQFPGVSWQDNVRAQVL
eukprot:13905714-Heterocapsa_arctica.AAC.1